jgi:hypothetical protein
MKYRIRNVLDPASCRFSTNNTQKHISHDVAAKPASINTNEKTFIGVPTN